MHDISGYLPRRINQGPWLTAYSLPQLQRRLDQTRLVLPICSLGTPLAELTGLADAQTLLLPPLYHEAFVEERFKQQVLDRIQTCFPYYEGTQRRAAWTGRLEVVELPAREHAAPHADKVVGFSVDTAVEEHGPHLPLATDTIQSYAVLERLADSIDEFELAPPVEYGHLTWGLPFGLSIDLTPPVLTIYVRNYLNGLLAWVKPRAVYVVDVHGSIVHREAIQDGIAASEAERTSFRWLHEPLVEFAGERGDQHAGGVETAVVELVSPQLVDSRLWPSHLEQLTADQMSLDQAVELSQDLPRFLEYVERHGGNGIVGNLRNYICVDGDELMKRMMRVARADVEALRVATGQPR